MLDNILFLASGNPDRKTDYVQEAEDAYKTVWRTRARNRKFRSADYDSYT